MKYCKVVATYFGKRHKPPTNGNEMLKHIKFLLKKELEVDSGVKHDLVFVNNESDFTLGNDFLNVLDGLNVGKHRIRVLNRPNIGISFGAFNYAFEQLKYEYDYFFFTEEDVVPNKEYYYIKCAEKLDSDPKIGFVGICGLSSSKGYLHCNGGIGCSTRQKLLEVYNKFESLPYMNNVPNLNSWKESIKPHLIGGEIAFTNVFTQLGYSIVDLYQGKKEGMHSEEDVLREKIWSMWK